MKILFDLCNTDTSTESSYLHQSLARAGADVHIWSNKNISAFDIFDSTNPDIFVSHFKSLSIDLLKRMSNSICKIVLNVSGITENEAKNLEQSLEEFNIKCVFVYYNFKKPNGFDKIKSVQIMPAADIFIPLPPRGNRQIPWGIVSNQGGFETVKQVGDVYHKININSQISDGDITYNIVDLNTACNVYSNILLSSDDADFVCGQLFFDLTLKLAGKCAVDINEQNQKGVVSFMEKVFPELPEDPEAAKEYLKNTILRKHTCVNRAERFAQNLGMQDELLVNLRKIQDSLKINLNNPRS